MVIFFRFVACFMLFSIFSTRALYAVSVGDSYGGGTVFCVSQTPDTSRCMTTGSGDYGLIMANQDQVNYDSNPNHGVTWSSVYSITGATSLDNGAANTATIIAALSGDNSTNNAAWLCHNYRDQEGHTDWYLPSKNELNNMYLYAKDNNLIGKGCSGSKTGGVQCLLGGYSSSYEEYWSSSEYFGSDYASSAWSQSFSYGLQSNNYKVNYYLGVRAIRAFNDSPIQPWVCCDSPVSGETFTVALSSGRGKPFFDNIINCCYEASTRFVVQTKVANSSYIPVASEWNCCDDSDKGLNFCKCSSLPCCFEEVNNAKN